MIELQKKLACPELGMGAGVSLSGGGLFSPAILFANGEQGVWFDPSDLSTMFADTAGTTPASVNGAVARINDKSGRGNHATQSTVASRPILRQAGGLSWLEFDGVDDFLVTGIVDFSASDKLTIWHSLRKLNDPVGSCVTASLGDYTDDGCLAIWSAWSGSSGYAAVGRGGAGTGTAVATAAGYLGVHTNLATAMIDIVANSTKIRVDAVQRGSTSTALGAGAMANTCRIFSGARSGSSAFAPIYQYGLIFRGNGSSFQQVLATERYLGVKAGLRLQS